VIERLDRQSGELLPFVTGAGGSIRPTPSPDGKSLAFVRRVRYKSTLFLLDLASGRETPLTDTLDRDMQETWPIHGVYPGMSWTWRDPCRLALAQRLIADPRAGRATIISASRSSVPRA
jgi:hypothetical protein